MYGGGGGGGPNLAVKTAKKKESKYAQPLWRKAGQNSDVPLVIVV